MDKFFGVLSFVDRLDVILVLPISMLKITTTTECHEYLYEWNAAKKSVKEMRVEHCYQTLSRPRFIFGEYGFDFGNWNARICMCVCHVCECVASWSIQSNLNINTAEKSHFQFSLESTKYENHQTAFICTHFAKRVRVSTQHFHWHGVCVYVCEWQISELGVKHWN